ncbi:MAG: PDZ domain-containing protein [Candidatus Omnitrophota bacterium]
MLSLSQKTALFIAVAAFVCGESCADTLHLKDKESLKGIVIEEYVDRVLFSTVDGEEEIMREDITDIEYDERADNLISLGDDAFDKGHYKTALKYYHMAREENPEITSLKDKIYESEKKISAAPELRKRELMETKNDNLSGYAPPTILKKTGRDDTLHRGLGIDVFEKDGRYYVKTLSADSPFAKGGLRRGDALIAVWSKPCDYLSLEDLYDLIDNPDESMVTVTIQRNLAIPADADFDAELEMRWEGVFVEHLPTDGSSQKSGIKLKDNIVAIDKEYIRYTPLKDAINSLKQNKERLVTVRRKINIFK